MVFQPSKMNYTVRKCSLYVKCAQNSPVTAEKVITQPDDNCPLDKDQLGRCTWSFLHTMAANYPETPNEIQRSKMKCFINTLADFYPCEPCAADLREQ